MLRKEFMNMVSCLKSDSNEAINLAKQLANIPAVEVNSIKVWTAPTEESTGPSTTVEFMGVHAKFMWHDHLIEIDENLNGKLIVKYDSKVIGEVFWSALWGKLEAMPNFTEIKLSKAQDYILDCIWKAVHRISAKGRPYGKCALPERVKYGQVEIWAEGATIYAKKENGETLRVMGNTWRGLDWCACDPSLSNLQKVIKKAFIVY
jgi:hypothetical protein